LNYGDGVYGGMFISAMYTQAFFAKNIHEVVENGLKAIPPQSLYAKLICDVIQMARRKSQRLAEGLTPAASEMGRGRSLPGRLKATL
jgi:hypothetical protein